MEEATTDDLAARVRGTLLDTSEPLWFPTITADLADAAWSKLGRDFRITKASYGTARVLLRDPWENRQVVVSFGVPVGADCDGIPVELLPESLARQCVGPDVRFFGAEEILGNGVFGRLEEALEIMGGVPTVLPTVCSLVRALHLIDSADDEVDISFSEPGLPFSAFISVPGSSAVAGAVRVAEALLHEAMHLQLTLVEAILPLVTQTERTYFSPWRNEYRTAQGILHALYVFRVIDDFLGAACFEGPALAPSRQHAEVRRAMIAGQVGEIQDFRGCADLTANGATFVARLLG
ncbi:MAG TPA: HEXXH motif-containing putative peptide modification protein [Thermoanaerobaculia bacterium]|jgi:HEXXH motif-containing protein|nr:HEXXH motif-containing putative peptide modification protein [Thermoanaerobaculia bacterium]